MRRGCRCLERWCLKSVRKQFLLNTDSRLQAREIEYPAGVVGVLTKLVETFKGIIYVLEGSLELDFSGTCDALEVGDCVAWIAGC